MFTGMSSAKHKITNNGISLQKGNTIFEKLSTEYNYNTGVFSSNGFLVEKDVGLRDCFETVVEGSEDDITLSNYKSKYRLKTSPNGFWYADKFIEFVDNVNNDWAACINIMDAHHPYEPESSYDNWGDETDWKLQNDVPLTSHWKWKYYSKERDLDELNKFRSLYYGGIKQADSVVEYIYTELEKRNVLNDTYIVICSDHGEGFGEPSRIENGVPSIGHGIGLHERLLHVPLIVISPEGEEKVISQLASIDNFTEFSKKVVTDSDGKEECFIEPNRLNIFAENYKSSEINESQLSEYNLTDTNLRDGYVSYKQDGDVIEKLLQWGNKSIKITFDTDDVTIESINKDKIDTIFEDITKENIKKSYDKKDITDSTKQRLKDFGYL